ncbi:GMC family oxidoreductase N-terminal domain-containing protein [Paraburkholderia sp. MMS20-SJTR3]|uniref:GMC family oxidoreductase N-terminal domain-containing protein n=1 Tax=Paraburkholderia sejongensis TaxID=2886946 RepID=A0ABS8K0S4_9BURK|nr:GMC family oxidoreductase N-terminal domain-containing protein [Paraburkholderia sp. MMS20-SJTR3]MCC8395757.1 GMC family oxidoreductase N-terminal domain-containing protein [Paraburkholderia sp. MMS20-SJTR3]
MKSYTTDYVIVGAGTAGCVLANRLTEDPNVNVILVEAGERDRHPFIHVPAGFVRLLDHPTVTWRYRTRADAETGGRAILFPRGRGLGGSSAINGLLYVRPFAQDIDSWEQSGARGWTFDNCLPFYRRSETWTEGNSAQRGTQGPIQVSRVQNPPEICGAVVQAAQKAGLEFVDDPNSDTRGPSIWYYQQTRDGRRRSSAARAYLRPAMARPNLKVVTGVQVSGLEMNGKHVSGVNATTSAGVSVQFRATREVILSAGVIGTPRLLEMSGIGDQDVLDNAGIRTRIALPGVGNNLQDHYVVRLGYRVRGAGTANERSHGLALAREMMRYVVSGTGVLTYSAAIVGGFAQTRLATRPDVQFVIAPGSFAEGRIGVLEPEPGVSCGVWQMRPESRGHVHITSSDLTAAPTIAPSYLSSELDRNTMVEGLKIGRRIFAQPEVARYIVDETVPGRQADTDDALLKYVRDNGSTVYHAVGTCRMGEDEMSVVDSEMRVRGTTGLRIVDGSVMPSITSTNTNATVLMLAERAADMIRSPVTARTASTYSKETV